jgi:hypothetical protein
MPVVDTTRTFTNNEQITSTKLNEIMDNSSFVSGAVVLSGGLEVTGGGQMQIASNGITTARIADLNVTTTKLSDGAITPIKLANSDFGDFTVSSGVATIDNNAITTVKIADSTSTTTGVTTSKIADANITAPKLSGTQTGTAPIFGIRAWAKLNILVGASSDRTTAFKSGNYSRTTTETTITGMTDHGLKANDVIRLDFTSGTGTDGLYTVTSAPSTSSFVVNHTGATTTGLVTAQFVKIQGSGNISSATFFDTSNNRVVLNFATPLPNANYATCGAGHHYSGYYSPGAVGEDTVTGIAQLNTVNQAYIYQIYGDRFASVIILG